MARGLCNIQDLWAENVKLGWEGASAISNALTKLDSFVAHDNPEIRQGGTSFGRLLNLEQLDVRSIWFI